MANIVTISDFKVPYSIAQAEQANVAAVIQEYIDRYEPEYLNNLLGVELYGLYKATPGNYPELNAGASYVNEYGVLVQQYGLKSGIVPYVYYFYLRERETFTTGSGEQKVNKGNPQTGLYKQVNAWNDMVTKTWQILGYVNTINTQVRYFNLLRPINALNL